MAVVNELRDTQRASRVAGRGLNPQVNEAARSSRPFPTQLSATPPAIHRLSEPVRA
ncbi:MAG: hypothetical protein R2712_22915 [Vicinamibacterales bacterium]